LAWTIKDRIIHAAIFVNNVESNIESNQKYTTGGDVGSQSFGGYLEVNADQVIDVRVRPDANTTIFPEHIQFPVNYIG
jgi:hypothetical protein